MANHKSAKKRIKQTIKRTERNKSAISKGKTYFKKVLVAIANNDKESANDAFVSAQSVLQKIVSKGILKKSTVSRKLSRLNSKIKSL